MPLQINEPATMITDYLIVAECAWLVSLLVKRFPDIATPHRRPREIFYWAVVFVAVAMTALLGGTRHGFGAYLGTTLAAFIQVTTLWSLSLTALGLSLAGLHLAFVPGLPRRCLGFLFVVKALGFAAWAAANPIFLVGLIDYLSALLFAACCWAWSKAPAQAKGYFFAGLAVSLVAGAIQALKLAPAEHFNHNDLYHVVQMVGLWLFYKAAVALGSNESSSSLGSASPGACPRL